MIIEPPLELNLSLEGMRKVDRTALLKWYDGGNATYALCCFKNAPNNSHSFSYYFSPMNYEIVAYIEHTQGVFVTAFLAGEIE